MAKKLMKAQAGKTVKPAAKPAEKKRTYKPDALQKMRYAMAPYVPFSKETAAESRKTDSIMDSNEMMRLRDKLGYEKKKGGATKKYATGGVVKNKTLNPAGAGLMKKGGSTKSKKK